MKIRLRFKLRQIVKWSLAVIALGWMIGATWVLFIQPTPTYYSAYNSPQAKLAKCRTLMSSEARYQCTSSLMLAKDNAVFNQALVIVLPAFGLMIAYLGVTRFYTAHRERVRSRSAIVASRKRMAEWRRQKAAAAQAAAEAVAAAEAAERARISALPAGLAARLATRPGGAPSGASSGAIPPRPARRQ